MSKLRGGNIREGDRVEYIGDTFEVAGPEMPELTLHPGELGWVVGIDPDGLVVVSWDVAASCVVRPEDVRRAKD